MAKIMVFEDDPLLAKMYHKMISFEGHEPVMVSDGQEGLQRIKTLKPDLVLMDIMMPKINGLQALDQLKKDPTTKDIPVIVFTNLANVNDEQDVLARGALKYVDKSQYDPKKVVGLIKEVLGSGSGAQAAQANQAPAAPVTPPQQAGQVAQTQVQQPVQQVQAQPAQPAQPQPVAPSVVQPQATPQPQPVAQTNQQPVAQVGGEMANGNVASKTEVSEQSK